MVVGTGPDVRAIADQHSLVLDQSVDEGMATFARLLEGVDVLIENLRSACSGWPLPRLRIEAVSLILSQLKTYTPQQLPTGVLRDVHEATLLVDFGAGYLDLCYHPRTLSEANVRHVQTAAFGDRHRCDSIAQGETLGACDVRRRVNPVALQSYLPRHQWVSDRRSAPNARRGRLARSISLMSRHGRACAGKMSSTLPPARFW